MSDSVTIAYNNATIHTATSTSEFTLPCKDKKMATNVTFTVEGNATLTVAYNGSNIIDEAGSGSYVMKCGSCVMSSDVVGSVEVSGGVITDLTGTSWYFNEVPNLLPSGANPITYNINLTTKDLTSNKMIVSSARVIVHLGDFNRYGYTSPDGWGDYSEITMKFTPDEAYRTINITGGTDATNTELIAWLQANATQI